MRQRGIAHQQMVGILPHHFLCVRTRGSRQSTTAARRCDRKRRVSRWPSAQREQVHAPTGSSLPQRFRTCESYAARGCMDLGGAQPQIPVEIGRRRGVGGETHAFGSGAKLHSSTARSALCRCGLTHLLTARWKCARSAVGCPPDYTLAAPGGFHHEAAFADIVGYVFDVDILRSPQAWTVIRRTMVWRGRSPRRPRPALDTATVVADLRPSAGQTARLLGIGLVNVADRDISARRLGAGSRPGRCVPYRHSR